MSKQSIILVGAALVLVVILFSLPKSVVDNSDTTSLADEQSVDMGSSPDSLHQVQITEADQDILNRLIGQLANYKEDPKKTTIFADSIASVYQRIGKLDSTAYYAGIAADAANELTMWEKAGNAYYEAFGFAMNETKLNELGDKTRFYLNKVLDAKPDRLDLKTKVAMTYMVSSNPMQGVGMLREVLAADPKNEQALFNMGLLAIQSTQYDRAVERFEEFVGYYPDHVQGNYYLGVSYFEAKQKKKAKEQFEKVKKMDADPVLQSSVDSYLKSL